MTSLLFKSDDALLPAGVAGKCTAASQTDPSEGPSSIASPSSSVSSSFTSDSDSVVSSQNYTKSTSKKFSYTNDDKRTAKFDGHHYDTKTRRCLLYNKIVELLPDNMVQPKGNLSDFVLV